MIDGESADITVQGRLTLADLETAYSTERNMVATVRGGLAARWAVPAFLAALLWARHAGEGIPFPLFMGLLLAVVGCFAPLLPRFLASREAENGLPARTYSIDADGVSIETRGNRYELKWTGVAGYDEGDEWLWIYPPQGIGIYVPKRFLSPDELGAVLSLLRQKKANTANREHTRKLVVLVAWVAAIGALLAYFAATGQR